jgi:hypothetical protein
MKKTLSALAILTGSVCALQAQTAGPLDFDTPGQLSGNFRPNFHGAFASEVTAGGQSFVEVSSAGVAEPWIAIYDTTPLDNSDAAQTFSGPFTLTLDITAATPNSSFGVFLFDAVTPGNNLLTIFNLDSSAPTAGSGNEQIRFWRDSGMATSAVSNIYSTAAFTGTNGLAHVATNSWITDGTAAAGSVTDTSSPYTFYTLTFAYDPIAATLRVASPFFSATLNIPAADVINNPAIALRINDPSVDVLGNNARIDNFAVVPEPMTASLFGFAGVALALRRPRRRA